MAKKKQKKYFTLKYLRGRFGLTQEYLGGKIGCSDTGFSLRENGKTAWQLTECETIRDIINELLKKQNEPVMIIDKIFFAEEVSKMTHNK